MAKNANGTQSQVQEQKVVQSTEVKSLYIKGENDKDFRTSDGFFKDPFTGVEFTGQEERLQLGTKTPRIKDSQGNPIPIAYKFWTKEERDFAKSGTSSGSKSGSSGNKKNNELRQSLLDLKEYLETVLPGDKKVAEMIGAMLPPDPEQEKLAKKVAGMSEEQKAALRALLSA